MDPENKGGFHEFRDQEIELECTHESSATGDVFERWDLVSTKPKLADKSFLRHFDRLLKPDPVGDGVDVTEDDVPF